MTRKAGAAVLMLAALAACGRNEESPPDTSAAPPVPEAPAASVPALDEFGPFEARVSDVAFWTHPSVPFNSMAIVATDNGLVALNIEDGKEIARVEGFRAGDVDVVYENLNAVMDAQGFRARGVAIVHDMDAKTLRFFEIHNATRDFAEIGAGFPIGEIEAFCAGPQVPGPARLVTFGGGEMRTYDVAAADDRLAVEPTALEDQRARPAPAAARGCVIDRREASLYVLYDTGEVAWFNERTGRRMEVFAGARVENPIGVDLVLNGAASDGDETDCCGQVGVLAADGAVRLYDIDDGAALGSVRLASSFDVEGVAQATAFGLGQGNFGGAYRDGVIALATSEETPVLRLAPLNGALDALGVKFGEAHNPRTMNPNPLERQCAALEDGGEDVPACAPHRKEAPFAGPVMPEFTPPRPRDADSALNEPGPSEE